MVGRLLANRTASPFSGVAGMPRNQGLASFGITGCFASEGPAGIRRNTHVDGCPLLSGEDAAQSAAEGFPKTMYRFDMLRQHPE